MITFTLPRETIKGMVAKLDTVAGTRILCNFFEEGLKQAEEKDKMDALAKSLVSDQKDENPENKEEV